MSRTWNSHFRHGLPLTQHHFTVVFGIDERALTIIGVLSLEASPEFVRCLLLMRIQWLDTALWFQDREKQLPTSFDPPQEYSKPNKENCRSVAIKCPTCLTVQCTIKTFSAVEQLHCELYLHGGEVGWSRSDIVNLKTNLFSPCSSCHCVQQSRLRGRIEDFLIEKITSLLRHRA